MHLPTVWMTVALVVRLVLGNPLNNPLSQKSLCSALTVQNVGAWMGYEEYVKIIKAAEGYGSRAIGDVLHVLMYPTDNAVYQALWVNQLSVDKILRHPEVAQDIVNLHLLPASVDKHKMKEFFSQTHSIGDSLLVTSGLFDDAGGQIQLHFLTTHFQNGWYTIRGPHNTVNFPTKGIWQHYFNSTECDFLVIYGLDQMLIPPSVLDLSYSTKLRDLTLGAVLGFVMLVLYYGVLKPVAMKLYRAIER